MFFGSKRRREQPRTRGEVAEPLTVRKYETRDRKAIRRITEAAFDGVCLEQNVEALFGPLGGTNWQERRCSYVEQDALYWPDLALVAEWEGEVVGYVTNSLDTASRTGHIRNLAVAPSHQGRGIGRTLIERALQLFKDEGMRHARIGTLAQNERCVAFYPRMGFREVARQVHYFRKLE